jgi:transposase
MKAKIESVGTLSNFVGVDISNDTIDVCFLINNQPHYNKFDQSIQGYDAFLSIFKMLNCLIIGFESTGVYHKGFEKYLIENGIEPFVLSPRRVHHFLKSSKRIKGKTDKSDSYGIALYLSKNDDIIFMTHPTREHFKPFMTSLALYDKQVRQTKNLLHSLKKRKGDEYLIDSVQNMIDVLDHQKGVLQKYAVDEMHILIPCSKIIESEIKGVGTGVLLHVLPLLFDNFHLFTIMQTVSFVGISPVPFESGSSVKKQTHISHFGDNLTRKALFMSAVSSVRNNPIVKEKFLRLVEGGKPKKKALMVIMSHILRLIVSRLSHHTGRPIKK